MNRAAGARNAGLHALAAVLIAVALNSVINLLGLAGDESLREPAWAPPGWLVGAVWVVLFALMGLAHWAAMQARNRAAAWWVAGLILLCAAYPFYTAGFDLQLGMIGNVVTLAAALAVAWRVRRTSSTAARLIMPVIAWIGFACVLTGTQIALN